MSNTHEEALRRATTVIQRLKTRVSELEERHKEPIAIVGVGCQLPGGVTDLSSLWALLANSQDAVGPIPKDRFHAESLYDPDPNASGKIYVKSGAFLSSVDRFDPSFFHLSPREALWVDPQHRLLLESAWEALEDAGIPPERLRETRTGVYVGIGPSDYAKSLYTTPPSQLEPYSATGNGVSFSAGRLSFLLGLQGPAIAVDTACSSSLVALHLACQGLRASECDVALAGGVQVMLAPEPFILLSRLRALAPDGRCKTFSEEADGYGRGEGCAVLVLKRLSDAKRSGDRILALVRGSAVNHDGPSSGLTTPNGASQQKVLKSALESAGLHPKEIEYVEAHGTGTPLGDPIEIEALSEVYGEGRAAPLKVGAIKSNIGHLESAAGIAGVLKVIASLQQGALPASLHAERLNSRLDWERLPIQVVRALEPWGPGAQPRRAGVSAFGMSGTNAHVILEEAPQESASPQPTKAPSGWVPLLLSAKTMPALRAQAGRIAQRMQAPEVSAIDLSYSLAATRTHHPLRMALSLHTGEDLSRLAAQLRSFASGGDLPAQAAVTPANHRPKKLAALFTGQGSQRLQMGLSLYRAFPVFREALDAVFASMEKHLSRPLAEVMFAEKSAEPAKLLDQTAFTQPALFALEVALFRLWESFGVRPDLLLGHSVGELAAAHVSGVFSLSDACALVAARGRLMQALPSGGAMISLEAAEEEVRPLRAGQEHLWDIAALNGPRSTVISGDEDSVLAIASSMERLGRRTTRLTVSHAFHSPLMDAMLDELRSTAQQLSYHAPRIPIVSNVTGRRAKAEELCTPEYWVRHARGAVRFVQGIRTLQEEGATDFLELGPAGVLSAMGADCLSEEGATQTACIPSLLKDRPEGECLARALGELYRRGRAIDWAAVFSSFGGRRIALPTYAFQKERYWLEPSSRPPLLEEKPAGRYRLSGQRLDLPDGSIVHRLEVGPGLQTYLASHVVYDRIVVPGAFYLSVLLSVAESHWPSQALELREVQFIQALTFASPSDAITLSLQLTPLRGEGAGFSASLATQRDGVWRTHATAILAPLSQGARASLSPIDPPSREDDPEGLKPFDATLRALQIQWGPSWWWLTQAARSGTQRALGRVRPPEGVPVNDAPIPAGLIDNCFALEAFAGSTEIQDNTPRLPFALERLIWYGARAVPVWGQLTLVSSQADASRSALDFFDEHGAPVAQIEGFQTRRAPLERLLGASSALPLYALSWVGLSLPSLASRDYQRVSIQRALQERNDAPSALVVPLFGEELPNDPIEATKVALHLLQEWLKTEHFASTRLVLLTKRAVSTSLEEAVDPTGAALWGLVRTAQMESPGRALSILDVDGTEASEKALPFAIASSEAQLALREGATRAPRLATIGTNEALSIPTDTPWCLDISAKGTLENLLVRPNPEATKEPGEGQVKVSLRAAGVNFRDALNALGMYPGDAGPLGGEGSGLVEAIGPGVTRFSVGDRVFGMLPYAFGSASITEQRLLAKIPAGWSFSEAASVAAAYLTAWLGLVEIGRLKPKERVLIHAAAGGVGLAAVQLARYLGAEVFATAHPSKHPFLRGLGFDDAHIASSRDAHFEAHFLKATQQQGMDVVLNSLTGELIDASLRLLAKGGRFLEMGKLDLRAPQEVAARYPNVAYTAFDLLALSNEHTQQMLQSLTALFEAGALAPLPFTAWDVRSARSAFRLLGQGRHIGKVVLTIPRPLNPKGTVLITGGTGGLGAAVARHLVAHYGAKRLVLLSRKGPAAEGADALCQELGALGALVTVSSCDVSEKTSVEKVLQEIPAEHPLTAVFHCAGVLEDGLLPSLGSAQAERVLGPKIRAALTLYHCTRLVDLSSFVLFSSVSGVLGSPGQAAYAAANAFLDAFAQNCRAKGSPALSLAWGPWAETGMAARLSEQDRARIQRQGLSLLSTAEALKLFDTALSQPQSAVAPVGFSNQALQEQRGVLPPVLRELVRAPQTALVSKGDDDKLPERLALLSDAERLRATIALVRQELASVLGLSGTEAISEKPLRELGLDSLMAVELRNRISARTQIKLPATLVFDYPDVPSIARFVVSQLTPSKGPIPRRQTLRPAASDAIAIIGMGCRFPGGVTDPISFWRLLEDETDAIREVPKERWDIERWYDPDPEARGKMYTRWGGFLEGLEQFDPAFFGISPREAQSVDPQERLLLEVTWEAIEHANLTAARLMGSDTGVFMGLCGNEYQSRTMSDAHEIDAYSALGTAHSTMVGRLSYWLGAKGPNFPVDTACSSSLVAVHLACQSLKNQECDLALAGGANVVLSPESTVYFSRMRAMSPRGRCHTFSQDADGYVRSEGCGVVVLKRLSDAKRDGDKILAVIRGSAINQDGRSNGLTAPNGPSQEEVIRRSLSQSGIAPNEVGYVECHGTGTPLGDPIEVQALGAALGEGRPHERPLVIGSVKTNIGHTEGAAGIAGLIKAVLCLQQKKIPKSLHFTKPNPHIPWSELPIQVAEKAQVWESKSRRIAGVSSFGFSGTNAHVTIEEAPEQEEKKHPTSDAPQAHLLLLSAKSEAALRAQAQRYSQYIQENPTRIGDICYTAANHRSHFEERLSATAQSPQALSILLAAFAQGEHPTGVTVGRAHSEKTAFLFTGQGAQRLGMGQGLYQSFPVFREALERCEEGLRELLPVPLLRVMWAQEGTDEASLLAQTQYTQPALFALEYSLYQLWRSFGVEAEYLLGHSIGELVAACVGGVFSLQDALRLVAARGRLMQSLPPGGAMISLETTEEDALLAVAPYPAEVSLAAINAPRQIVISGKEARVLEIAARYQERGVSGKRLSVSHAFHSPLMEPMLAAFEEVAQTILYQAPHAKIISNISGQIAGPELQTALYWVNQIRASVRFYEGTKTLQKEGVKNFVELGPRPVLLGLLSESLEGEGSHVSASLRPNTEEHLSFVRALGECYVLGHSLQTSSLYSNPQKVALPSYPFQRSRYWIEVKKPKTALPDGAPGRWALSGVEIKTPAGIFHHIVKVGPTHQPYLVDHAVYGSIVVPAAFYISAVLAVAAEHWQEQPVRIEAVELLQALVLAPEEERALHIVLTQKGNNSSFEVATFAQQEKAPWKIHARGSIQISPSASPNRRELSPGREISKDEILQELAALQIVWGPTWSCLQSAKVNEQEARLSISTLSLPPREAPLHPALLDNGFVTGVLPLFGREKLTAPFLPFAIERLDWYRIPTTNVQCDGVLRPSSTTEREALVFDLTLHDDEGVFARIEGFTGRKAPKELFLSVQESPNERFTLTWVPLPARPALPHKGRWLLLATSQTPIEGLQRRLLSEGAQPHLILIDTDLPSRLAEAAQGDSIAGVVCAWLSPLATDVGLQAQETTLQGLRVLQALSRLSTRAPLWWLTQGAQPGPSERTASPVQAALWGLGRVWQKERLDWPLHLVDLSEGATPEALCSLLGADSEERQLRLQGEQLFGARLLQEETPKPLPDTPSYRLAKGSGGLLQGLSWVGCERRAPAPGEVEIEVLASGLNFRDVLSALGLYPGDAGSLGLECAGVVTRVGDGVTHFAIGDEVVALGGFARYLTLDARYAARKPRSLSLAQAAGVLGPFVTAWYGLRSLARLQPNERVLIHAAAGGVGMAAVQLARLWGASVLATASPSKWDALRALGVEHLASSRSLAFQESFRQLGPVDVVLNSLTGDFIDASLSLLQPGGRFLELGKRDLRDPSWVASSYSGVWYRPFDLLEIPPDELQPLLEEILSAFDAGLLTPLPTTTFSLVQAEEAFRYMAQGQHIGKIVLVSPERSAVKEAQQGTILITGGLGALGLSMARWLASQGCQELLLVGRRGENTEGAREALQALRALGARVSVASVDLSDAKALEALLREIPKARPLRGVIHTAGLLDDALLEGQSEAQIKRIFAGKVLGAWNLHEATKEAPLAFFVMTSSVSSLFGNPGQAGYAAANAFLDGLAQLRQKLGLPALSLRLGPIEGPGMAASLSAADKARMSRVGVKALTPERVLAHLERSLQRRPLTPIIASLDPLAPDFLSLSSLVRGLAKPKTTEAKEPLSDLKTLLSSLTPKERRGKLLEVVSEEAARVLASPSVKPTTPLRELGMDSLMAVELRNVLSKRSGSALPATLVFDYPHPEAITDYLLTNVFAFETVKKAQAPPQPTAYQAEPIAIIGMGCRFPGGAADPASFFRLLEEGKDAIKEVPPERWRLEDWYDPDPNAPGKMYTRHGGFLSGVESFDPQFFDISPREAPSIDPQQRLLLEVSFEALEDAGITKEKLLGSDTGVYIGICGNDFQARAVANAEEINAYSLTGTAHSTSVGRLSYWLGLQGPNVPVDTACSSSLVAVHLACQALRAKECAMALAGGVNLLLAPEVSVYFSKVRAVSPEGHCKAFDISSDGYVRSEGCGVVLLKRLSDAKRDKDRILAVIRGTAINQDGRSQGLTAPNGLAQQAVIRQALAQGGLHSEQIDYVECHGTGTPLGDPIEVQSLAAVYGEGHSQARPVIIGSVKTNIGHTEGAAGIAGLIKATLALQHQKIPKSLHFKTPNPHIPWAALPVRVAEQTLDWRRGDRPRLVGISSFGFSGTNAHVILEEPPQEEAPTPAPQPERPAHLLVLSAKTDDALRDMAARYAQHLASHSTESLAELCYSSATSRTHFEHRAAFVVQERATSQRTLEAFSLGGQPPDAFSRRAELSPKVAFLFTGQGSQYPGMGQDLYQAHPVFREALDECALLFSAHLPRPLLEVMFASAEREEAALLSQTGFTQPALFALEYALYRLWRSFGVVPDVLLGHSIGELVAACVAEVFSLEEAVRLVSARASLMQGLSNRGAMLSVVASEAEVTPLLQGLEAEVSIAAINAPRQIVLSGKEERLGEIERQLEERGIRARRLSVSHAFHSPLMEPMLAAFEKVAQTLSYQKPKLPLIGNLSGQRVEDEVTDPSYWVRHVKAPVRFADGMRALASYGAQCFLELGPQPILLTLGRQCLPEHRGAWLPSLRPAQEPWPVLLGALGELYVHGAPVDFAGVDAFWPRRRVDLPRYPFQRARFWIEAPRPRIAQTSPAKHTHAPQGHPLLGGSFRVSSLPDVQFWESTLSRSALPWLADHQISGACVFPGAGYLEMGLSLLQSTLQRQEAVLEEITFTRALVLPVSDAVRVQTALQEEGGNAWRLVISQEIENGQAQWQELFSAQLKAGVPFRDNPPDKEALHRRCQVERPPNDLYEALGSAGLQYGPAFRGLRALWYSEEGAQAIGRVELPERAGKHPSFAFHPALLDACLHVVAGAQSAQSDRTPKVPVSIKRVQLRPAPRGALWCAATLTPSTKPGDVVATLHLWGDSGAYLGCIEELRLAPIEKAASVEAKPGKLLGVSWVAREDLPKRPPKNPGRWMILSDTQGFGQKVSASLEARGAMVRLFSGGAVPSLEEGLQGILYVRGLDSPSMEQLPPEEAYQAGEAGWAGLLSLVRALAARPLRDPPRLILVTHRSQAPQGNETIKPEQALLWGVGASLHSEQPMLRPMRVDVSSLREEEAEALASLALSDTEEDQIALRGGLCFTARLVREEAPKAAMHRVQPAEGRAYRVEVTQPGLLDSVRLFAFSPKAPAEDEVEISVEAAGVNFLDVLSALGEIPRAGRVSLGGEYSGRITRVGANVKHLSEGQRVIALTADAFANYALARQSLVFPIPEGLSAEEAATLPVAHLTAYYSLHHIARLRAKERVLIHSAAGGVGLAALQWARHVGAVIFATTGTQEKRDWLKAQGIEYVSDSHSERFVEDVLSWTNGEGVDVVLNSLAGPLLEKSLGLLGEEGRFVEIGKRDYLANKRLGLKPFLKGISYTLVDLASMLERRPEKVRALFLEVLEHIKTGALSPLPSRSFLLSSAADAFWEMGRGRHIGKLLLTTKEPAPKVLVPVAKSSLCQREASYLITGGLGGLGLSLAQWMASQGAGHLVLMSRHSAEPSVQATIEEIRAAGSLVTIAQGDVSDRAQLARILASISKAYPLRGVVHTAGVLDDGVLTNQTRERFYRVIAPKAAGAWNLHTLTQHQPLDFFVLYSSAAALLGSPGQGSYAAANAFLDALAHYRHNLGLPALSLSWGAFEEVGMAARSRGAHLGGRGIETLSPKEGQQLFAQLVATERPHLAPCPINAQQWIELYPQYAGWPYLEQLLQGEAQKRDTSDNGWAARLGALSPEEAQEALSAHLLEQLGHVLRVSPAKLSAQAPFQSMGLDSLMGLELRNRLSSTLGVQLPATAAWTYPDVTSLSAYLLKELLRNTEAPVSPAPKESAPPIQPTQPQDLEALSDEELLAAALLRLQE